MSTVSPGRTSTLMPWAKKSSVRSRSAEAKASRLGSPVVPDVLSVTIRDLSQIGAVLDAAMSAGANTTYGISFSSTQENEAYQKALTRAVEDAAQKAQVLAAAAGKTLGELVTIDATNSGFAYGVSNVYSEKAMDAGSVIVSGDVSVTANVTLEYAFK